MSNTIYDVIQNTCIQQLMLSQLTKFQDSLHHIVTLTLGYILPFFAMCIWLQYFIMIAVRLLFVYLLCIPS